MNLWCPRGIKPIKKKEKDFGKNKSINFTLADTSSGKSGKQLSSTQQTSSTNPMKDQDHQRGFRYRGRWNQGRNPDYHAMDVNIIPKKEGRDISQVEYYNCYQKEHYSNKCP